MAGKDSLPTRRLFGKPIGIGLIVLQKSIAALFFGFVAVLFLVFYFKGMTHPFQALFLRELHEDPRDRLAIFAIRHLPEVSKSALLRLGLGSLLYFLLEAAEAIGLMLDQYWVEIFIVVETGLFLPFEIRELALRVTWVKIATLLVNLLILWYLVRRYLRKQREYALRKAHRVRP